MFWVVRVTLIAAIVAMPLSGFAADRTDRARVAFCEGVDLFERGKAPISGNIRIVAVGASGKGLCDLTGNVFEWIQDEYHSCEGAPTDGNTWGEGSTPRLLRGGGFVDKASLLRATYRFARSATVQCGRVGFRCARSPGQRSFLKTVL